MSCPPNGMHERGHFNAPVITFVYFPPLSARLENALTSGRRKRSIASRLRSNTPFQHIPNAGPSLMIEGTGERDREEKTRKRHTYPVSRLGSFPSPRLVGDLSSSFSSVRPGVGGIFDRSTAILSFLGMGALLSDQTRGNYEPIKPPAQFVFPDN